ncbi:hypothetical protein OH77DRAFT_1434536 [Trametes cingulata]|nr:hypothetical protein OH77DRAFT_1434536 [Trametes cingulata]
MDLPVTWHVDHLLHNLPNLQLTRIGDHYPYYKVRALDALHAAARDTPPYALAALPLEDAQWSFLYPYKCAELHSNERPLAISMIGILDEIQLSSARPYITLYPFYANDAARAKELLASWKEINIEIDDECEEPPILLRICTANGNRNAKDGIEYTKPRVTVYDDTALAFNDSSPVISGHLLKRHDLVVARCYMNLRANPALPQPPSYFFAVDEIRLVHIAPDLYSDVDLDEENDE